MQPPTQPANRDRRGCTYGTCGNCGAENSEHPERFCPHRPTTKDGKSPRLQPQNEKIVLVIDHFGQWLDNLGLGASVLNAFPHLYTGTHWKTVLDADCENWRRRI